MIHFNSSNVTRKTAKISASKERPLWTPLDLMRQILLGSQISYTSLLISNQILFLQAFKTGNRFSGIIWKTVSLYSYFNSFLFSEHFIVWMRTAGLPNFRKLWGKIDAKLDAGSYQLVVKNNYEVSSF
jgi:hypothetical protein